MIGTAPYMSPEQARGAPVDRRTDIWAFGCVLFEMLTGRLAFDGNTRSDIVAGILEREPDWATLPADTPAAVRRLLRRCLEKDQRRRFRDIGDIKLELEDIASADAPSDPGRSHRSRPRAVPQPRVAAIGGVGRRGSARRRPRRHSLAT